MNSGTLSEDIWKRPGQLSEWEWAPGPVGRQRGTGAPPWNCPGEGGVQAENQVTPHTETLAAVAQHRVRAGWPQGRCQLFWQPEGTHPEEEAGP